jgi:[ribosomal protein S18]-alanine N-acetyltransferase
MGNRPRSQLANNVTSVRVSPASLDDVRRVAEIEVSVFTDPWSEEFFRTLPGDQRILFACARTDASSSATRAHAESVRGYVVAVFAADEAEIANLAVADDARGIGVGSALLDAVLVEARTRRSSAMYLEVRESNAVARRLYGSRGFLTVGRRKGYYRRPTEDALVLSLRLGPSFV